MNPKFLGFHCQESKGQGSLCESCPLKKPLFCSVVREFIEQKQRIIFGAGAAFVADDPTFLLPLTLASLEKGVGNYKGTGSFAAFINKIYRNKAFDRLRKYHEVPVPLKVIFSLFDEGQPLSRISGQCDETKKIRYAFIPKTARKVSAKVHSILVVNSDKTEFLAELALIQNRIILAHGNSEPDASLGPLVEMNGGMLLWFPGGGLSGKAITNKINNEIRTYLDVQIGLPSPGGGEGKFGNKNEKPDDEGAKKRETKESNEGFVLCLEKMLTNEDLKKCASYFLLFLATEKSIEEMARHRQEDFLKNGSVRLDSIYYEMAQALKNSPETVARIYKECLANGAVYRFLEICLDGYDL